MLTFRDTQIAFAWRSNNELVKAKWLFGAISWSLFVRIGENLTKLATTLRLPIAWFVKPTIFSHFVGGETLAECLPTVERLQKFGVGSILDYSVEGQQSEESFSLTYNEILRTIQFATSNPSIHFAVFKPSGIARVELLEKASNRHILDENEENELMLFKERVSKLCQTSANLNIPILIDAEDSWYQPVIDSIALEMMQIYNKEKAIVYNTLQLYRVDRLKYLHSLLNNAIENKYILGIKLVRGAYMEKERNRASKLGYPSPIHDTKTQTDEAFNLALRFSVENINHIALFCGTHNEESIAFMLQLMEEKQRAKNDQHVSFSQLYGMSDNISFALANEGYNVSKYIPYGPVKEVLPYLIRRAQENTSVKGQTGRELALIKQEINRRKSTL